MNGPFGHRPRLQHPTKTTCGEVFRAGEEREARDAETGHCGFAHHCEAVGKQRRADPDRHRFASALELPVGAVWG